MESQDKNRDWRAYAAETESDASPEHRRIRATLLGLPKETCPVGFEFRLMQRIDGKTSRRTRTSSNWVLGWAGAGLGLAVAMFVSFTALDFNFNGSPDGTAVTKSGVDMPTSRTLAEEVPATEKSTTVDQSEPVLPETDLQLASTEEDSAGKVRRGEIPSGLDQRVSGTKQSTDGGK